ncbi:MAG: glycosyltransferase family 1 protein [Actinomycetota bacterium]
MRDGLRVALQAGQLDQAVPGGIGRYVEGLLRHLPEVGVTVERFSAGRWRYEAWHRFRRPVVRVPGDLVHAPSLAVPPPGRRPLVVTVHDLAFRTHPECFPPRGRAFHERGLALARAEAAAVVVPSAATAAELRDAGFEAGRIHVAHHGIDLPPPGAPSPSGPDFPAASMNPMQQMHPHWQPAEGPTGGAGGSAGLGTSSVGDHGPPVLGLEPRSYLLFVGTVEPRKGVDVLLAAHATLRRHGHPDLRLVVAGPPGWGETPPLDEPGVVAPGRVDEHTLDALYRGAAVLVVPSRSEGFGLPALEAMARGRPVVVSDAGALPEVVGDAGVLVPPGDAEALAAALDRLLTDAGLAASVGHAGRRRAATFTWSACTAAHLAAYHAALGRPVPPPPSASPAAAPPATPPSSAPPTSPPPTSPPPPTTPPPTTPRPTTPPTAAAPATPPPPPSPASSPAGQPPAGPEPAQSEVGESRSPANGGPGGPS